MHNQFKTQKFKHLMLAMGPRDLNSAPYSPVHCSSHSITSFQSSELTELPVVENSQLFAHRALCAVRVHSARTTHGTPPQAAPPIKICKHFFQAADAQFSKRRAKPNVSELFIGPCDFMALA